MADSKREWVWDGHRESWYSSDGQVVNARRFGASTPKWELDKFVDRFNEGIQPFIGEAAMPSPHFTKKHYEQLAIVLRNSLDSMPDDKDQMERYIGASMIVTALIEHFKKDNPRFDKTAFLKALSQGDSK